MYIYIYIYAYICIYTYTSEFNLKVIKKYFIKYKIQNLQR